MSATSDDTSAGAGVGGSLGTGDAANAAVPPFKGTRDYVKKITGMLADEGERRAAAE
jgi:hypothetical protein